MDASSPKYNQVRKELGIALLNVGGVRLSPPFVEFNLHTPGNPTQGPITTEIINIATTCMAYAQKEAKLIFDAIAGVPRAGDPLTMALSGRLRIERIIMEWYGVHITGLKSPASPSVKKALLVDDLILAADSKLEAIKVLEDAGIEVNDVLVLVDCEQGGREELEANGYAVHSVFTVTSLLNFLVEAGRVAPRLRASILAQWGLQK